MNANLVIFDQSKCKLRWGPNRGSLALLAPSGELLSVVACRPAWSARECALRAFDTALASAFVSRSETAYKVALLNNHTMHVAVGALPGTLSFPLADATFPASGLDAFVEGDIMRVNGTNIAASGVDSFSALCRARLAHL
jgi:hypothetical protein